MRKNVLLTVLTSAVLICMMLVSSYDVMAADIPVRENVESSATDGKVIIGVEGIDCTSSLGELLEQINRVRYEACHEGNVPDPRDTSRMLTPADYVPVKIGQACTKAAKIRAAEGDVYLGHARPDGTSCSTVLQAFLLYNGMGENLGWSGGSGSYISGWIGEKDDYVKGNYSSGTGHYQSLINPNYRYTGMSTFNPVNDDLKWDWACTAGQYATNDTELTQLEGAKNERVIQKILVKTDSITSCDITGPAILGIGKSAEYGVVATVAHSSFVGSSVITGCPVYDGVTYSSSDPSVLTVSDNGTAVAHSEGTAIITAVLGGKEKGRSISKQVRTGDSVSVNGIKAPETITVETNKTPELPTSVKAVLSDGSELDVNVMWNSYDKGKLLSHFKSVEFDVDGIAEGFEVKQRIHVNAAQIQKVYVTPSEVVTDHGVVPTLPDKVKINLSNGYTWSYNSNWGEAYKEYCNTPGGGKFTVKGYATPAVTTDEGTRNLEITLTLIVNPEVKNDPVSAKIRPGSVGLSNDVSEKTVPSGNTSETKGASSKHEEDETYIDSNIYRGNKKIKKIRIGEKVKGIGKNAFKGCSSLKKIVIRSTKLNKKNVKAGAFAGLKKNITVIVPKGKKKEYKKLLLSRGLSKKARIICK